MKPLNKFPAEYFQKYKEKSVILKPYDPKASEVANELVSEIQHSLERLEVEVMVKGSTAFRILGKGDIEIGVYPERACWSEVISRLTTTYGAPDATEDDYHRFNITREGFEVEIVLLKGYEAKLDKAMTDFLIQHPQLLAEYEDTKQKYAYSKREYQIHKNEFFTKVAKLIPEPDQGL